MCVCVRLVFKSVILHFTIYCSEMAKVSKCDGFLNIRQNIFWFALLCILQHSNCTLLFGLFD